MTDKEKLKIINTAIKLIDMLKSCDDEGLVDIVLNSTYFADTSDLEELKRWY